MESICKKNLFIFFVLLLMTVIFAFLLWDYLFSENNLNKKVFSKQEYSQNYVSGVVPHHLVAKSIMEKFFVELSRENNPQTIILFSPDHFNAASIYENKLMTVNLSTTNIGNLVIDNQLLNTLSEINDFAFSDYVTKNDHGVMNILPFIEQYFPNAKIIPFLIPTNFPFDKTKKVVENLDEVLPDNSFILSSVDWSHYLPNNAADFHDTKSIRVFLNFEEENFSNIEVDCPQCLYISRYFAKLRKADNYIKIDHKNSQDFSNSEILDSTTSYFSVLFSKQKSTSEINDYPKTILFLGDIMLDRTVKELMEKNGLVYPIEKIRNFLKGVDVVVGNLEGPVVIDPVYTPDTSMKFNFGSEALDLLSYAKINLVSLANNHTLDRDRNGLTQTKEFLSRKNINYFGDPINCLKENIYTTDGMVFIGLNQTFPINCTQEQIRKLIKDARQENSDDFIVVFIHWGEEYKSTSNAIQKELAHLIIDSGADLIIGSHPHVVEEIEQYKGKLIFYSLGNFIFDQYFSKETQEGLVVGLEITDSKTLVRLFPIGIYKSQPYLFNNMDRVKFLENLSVKSPTIPKYQIINGLIATEIP